jgi:hypothetical protein
MKKLIAVAAATVIAGGVAFAQTSKIMSSIPTQSVTVTGW